MRIAKKILIALSVICLLPGCNETSENHKNIERVTGGEPDTKYFLKLTGVISPYQAYRPRIPITRSEAESTNHYAVNYDSNGRISRIVHFSKGLLNDNSYIGVAVVEMEYKDTQFIRKYFNQNMEPAGARRHYYGRGDQNIHKEVFELDDLGRRQSLTLYDTTDQQVETGFGTYRFEWETQADGSFIQKALKRNGEINIFMDYFDFLITHITLDENGYLDLVKNYGERGRELVLSEKKKAAYVDFHFDEYGNEESYSFHDEQGNLVNRGDTGFGSYGYAKVRYIRKTPAKGINDGYETIFFDKNNRQTTASDGIARQVDHFNDNGDYSGTEYYSLDGEKLVPAGIGYFRTERLYNEKGDKSETRYYDREGSLTNSPSDGAAIIKFIYDDSRNIKTIEKIKVEPN
jgi:hypothetical protein